MITKCRKGRRRCRHPLCKPKNRCCGLQAVNLRRSRRGVDEAEEEGDEIGEACDAAVAPGPKRKASAIHDLDILIGAMDGRAAEQKAKKAGAKAKAKAAAKAEASTGDDDGGDEAGEEAAPEKAVVPKKKS